MGLVQISKRFKRDRWQHLIDVPVWCKFDHDLQFLHLHINRIIVLAEEHLESSYSPQLAWIYIFENLWEGNWIYDHIIQGTHIKAFMFSGTKSMLCNRLPETPSFPERKSSRCIPWSHVQEWPAAVAQSGWYCEVPRTGSQAPLTKASPEAVPSSYTNFSPHLYS